MTKRCTGKVNWGAVIVAGYYSFCLLAPGMAIGAEPLKKMRVAIPSIVIDFAPLWIARDKGLFREERVEVEITYIQGNIRGVQSLLAGEVQAGAFALAVTSFEELGKMHVIDRGCDGICLNPDSFDEIYEMYFIGPWLTDHLHKQRQALFDALNLTPDQRNTLWAWVDSGGLENERRIALYVEMTDRSVNSVDRITEAKAKRVLDLCYSGLVDSAKLAFNGVGAEPSAKVDWLAATAIKQIEAAHARYLDA